MFTYVHQDISFCCLAHSRSRGAGKGARTRVSESEQTNKLEPAFQRNAPFSRSTLQSGFAWSLRSPDFYDLFFGRSGCFLVAPLLPAVRASTFCTFATLKACARRIVRINEHFFAKFILEIVFQNSPAIYI